MTTTISIQMLEGAINAARTESPTASSDHSLSADIAALAEIYGLLIFKRHSAFDLASLEPSTRDILVRWLTRVEQDKLKHAA